MAVRNNFWKSQYQPLERRRIPDNLSAKCRFHQNTPQHRTTRRRNNPSHLFHRGRTRSNPESGFLPSCCLHAARGCPPGCLPRLQSRAACSARSPSYPSRWKIQAPGALTLFLDGQTVDVDGMVIIRDPDCMRPRSQVFSDLARRPLVPRCAANGNTAVASKTPSKNTFAEA